MKSKLVVVLGLGALVACTKIGAPSAPAVAPSVGADPVLRGVNIIDLGQGIVPGTYGTDYTAPSLPGLQFLHARRLQVLRLTIAWERIQPALGAALDPTYLGYLRQTMRSAAASGLRTIVDVHNYGRYNGSDFGNATGPTSAQFADLWSRISAAVRADAASFQSLYAYDLMIEPHDFTTTSGGPSTAQIWEAYAQAAVTAIRAGGDTSFVMVEGVSYSSASQWPTNHPNAWIVDPADRIIYQAHCYGDTDGSGTYVNTFATEQSQATGQGYASVADRYVKRLKPFGDWLSAHHARGFIGELGWPNADTAGAADAAAWNAVGDAVLGYLDQIALGATLWMTGSWQNGTSNVMTAYVITPPASVLSPAPTFEAHTH